MIHRHVSAGMLSAALVLAGPRAGISAAAGDCDAVQIALVGRAGRVLIGCEARAAAHPGADLGRCRAGAEKRFARNWSYREQFGCVGAVEVARQQARTAASEMVDVLIASGASGKCAARKLRAASVFFQRQARIAAVAGSDPDKVAAVRQRLDARFADIEERFACDGAAGETADRLVARIDAADMCIRNDYLCAWVEEAVPAGGAVSTDVDDPDAADPLAATLETPNAGVVTVTKVAAGTSTAPAGFAVLGFAVQIEAPQSTVADPLILTLHIDASLLPPPAPVLGVQVFRNGTLVADCAGAPGQAVPDPCVASRSRDAGGDIVIVVHTSHTSEWAAGVSTVTTTTTLASTTTTTLATTTTTLTAPVDCDLVLTRTDAGSWQALQIGLDYSGTAAEPMGAGTAVACTTTPGGSLAGYYDDETAAQLRASLISLSGVSTPGDVARCTFQAATAPTAGDFSPVVIDAVDAGATLSAGGGICGSPVTGASPPYARDALLTLRASVGLVSCPSCECDVNSSGATTAADALTIVRKSAAGADDGPALTCPQACGSSTPSAADPGSAAVEVSSVVCH